MPATQTKKQNQRKNSQPMEGEQQKLDRKKQALARSRFYRRKKGIFIKGFEIYDICQAEVHILLKRKGQTYILSSTKKSDTPFREQVFVCRNCPSEGRKNTLIENRRKPILHLNGFLWMISSTLELKQTKDVLRIGIYRLSQCGTTCCAMQ